MDEAREEQQPEFRLYGVIEYGILMVRNGYFETLKTYTTELYCEPSLYKQAAEAVLKDKGLTTQGPWYEDIGGFDTIEVA